MLRSGFRRSISPRWQRLSAAPSSAGAWPRSEPPSRSTISSPDRNAGCSKALLPEAWTLRHNVTVTDALYVVLARHLEAALVTADLKLAVAPGLDIEIVAPPAS